MIFIGGIFLSNKNEIFSKSIGPVQFAASNLQKNIIKGLELNLNEKLDIINAVFIGSFPKKFRSFNYKGEKHRNTESVFFEDIGFLNLPIIKQIHRTIEIHKSLVKWKKTNPKDKRIIIYSLHLPFVLAATHFKKSNNGYSITLIVPDLPEFMNFDEKVRPLFSFLKMIDTKLIYSRIKHVDSLVVLTEKMMEKMNVTNIPYVVIEGMCDPTEGRSIIQAANENPNEKIILYSGSLHKKFGILLLIEAMLLLSDSSYKLWICGEGDAKNDILEATKSNNNITFFGQIERDDVLDLQSKCTVLVNPRSANDIYTMYSFPSKTFEYLLAAKPVIMDKLKGIPKEYYEYLYFVEEYSPKGFAEKIKELCNMSNIELLKIGQKCRDFVINEKNYIKQCEKIIQLTK